MPRGPYQKVLRDPVRSAEGLTIGPKPTVCRPLCHNNAQGDVLPVWVRVPLTGYRNKSSPVVPRGPNQADMGVAGHTLKRE